MANRPPAVLRVAEHGGSGGDDAAALFEVLSYNVLLPNSRDGWWISKYYHHSHAPSVRAWPWRCRLLQEQILPKASPHPTIVCLQEVSPISFDDDFRFMKEAGYEHELLNKGRMRNATFWDPTRLERLSVAYKDRTLLCRFALVGQASNITSFYVVNCHLSAGPQPKRRLTQVHQVTETIRKQLTLEHKQMERARGALLKQGKKKKKKKNKNKKKEEEEEEEEEEEAKEDEGAAAMAATLPPLPSLALHLQSANIIICGDFNSQGNTGVRQLLTQGHILPSYRECGDPTEKNHPSLTSKEKGHPFTLFEDVYHRAFAVTPSAKPPATLICPDLMDKMVDPNDGTATPAMVEKWRSMFDKLRECKPLPSAGDVSSGEMSREAVDAWLVRVNGVLGRGSEYRAAYRILDGDDDEGRGESKTAAACVVKESRRRRLSISFEEFCSVYQAELDQGKFWGVEHDVVAVLGPGRGLCAPGSPPFCARFDQMWSTTTMTMRCAYVKRVLTEEHRRLLLETCESVIPNEWHPSDHLALRAGFHLPRPGWTSGADVAE
jgi:endonuclease/exonuclease/phosphatase family metal-dependent hydrolase